MSGDLIHSVATAASQLPPEIQKSFFKAVGTLITGSVDVAAAWFESKAALIRAKTTARTAVIEAAGKAAAESFAIEPRRVEEAIEILGETVLRPQEKFRDVQGLLAVDPDLADRTATFAKNRAVREQVNRESVARAAILEIARHPPSEDSTKTISPDWVEGFTRVAEARSDPEMQAYFARILAGEIKAPGSFSPVTLDVASKLTTDVAILFQTFCNASISGPLREVVLSGPFGGNPGGNTLRSVGLPYDVLTQLQDMRLVLHDLTSYIEAPMGLFTTPFELGGVRFKAEYIDSAKPTPGTVAMPTRIEVLNFTRAGRELRRIVDMTPHPVAIEKLAEYLGRNSLVLTRLS